MSRLKSRAPYAAMDLGERELPEVDDIITRLVDKRHNDEIPDLFLFLSYKPCLAVGSRQLDERDFLKPREYFAALGIPLYKTVRGGGLTFHWPGQLVCYPILKLAAVEQNIPRYMTHLEEIGLLTLAELGVHAQRKREVAAQIGLWVGDDKIASMGIRISRWVTSYGFALNLGGDASPAQFIRPCGLDVNLTTVEEQTGNLPSREHTKLIVQEHFGRLFDRETISQNGGDIDEIQKVVHEYRSRVAGNPAE